MTIEIHDMSFGYAEHPAVRNVSLKLDPGMFYGILGPNGCGKTTLVDLLIRHRTPDAGEITYQGKPLTQYTRKQISRHFALVPQQYAVDFPFTSRQIVMMGRYPHLNRFAFPDREDHRQVDDIMEQTGTRAFENRFISELSGGERQRVIFARALVQNTPVLILDEATSNLDISHAISLFSLAFERVVSEGKTVIAVMQDINLAALFCQYLILMKNGQVIHHGPCEQVLTETTIQSVFQVKAKVYEDAYANARQVVFSRSSHVQ
jgi:ABC-type cobalamin/Fe3+-siderophores transport system ATPase subunit